jgi:hypothetical protein
MNSLPRYAIVLALSFSCAIFNTAANSQTKPVKKAPTSSVAGRITIHGKGAAGIVVGMRSVDFAQPPIPVLKATTDQDGNYRIAGERVTGLTVTLAEGAASLRGAIKPGAGESIPTKLYAYLVPAEKENAEDVLRFFAAPVNAGGTFTFNNLPPGRYWALARVAPDSEPHSDAGLREPEEAVTRAQVRRAAEAGNKAVELRPCQNVIDYALPFTMSPLKN